METSPLSKISRMKLLKFWSFFLVTQAQKVIWGQKCAEVPNLKDFELAKYAGVWYEQVRYPNTFQKEGSMLVYRSSLFRFLGVFS